MNELVILFYSVRGMDDWLRGTKLSPTPNHFQPFFPPKDKKRIYRWFERWDGMKPEFLELERNLFLP